MEGVSSPSMEQVGTKSFFSPLLISMFGVVVTTMAILAYHLILVKYCIRRYAANTAAAQPPAAPRPPTGVDEKILEAIPILAFLTVKRGNDQGECVVCLGELEDEDAVRLLPNCNHAFHVSCIDQWFAAHTSCPLCRSPVLRQQADAAPAAPDLVEDPNNGGGSGDNSATNDNGESPWRGQSIGLVRSCSSVETTRMDEISGWRLKRSLSIDLSVVVIDLERANCPRTTSFSPRGIMRSGSLSHFDRVLRSFSWLRPGKPSSTPPILPY